MLSARSPIATGMEKLNQKSNRKPLQPRNFPVDPTDDDDLVKKQPKKEWIEISLIGNANKENHPPITTTPTNKQIHHHHQIVSTTPTNKPNLPIPMLIDSSLAEELSVIRRKFERLRLEKEKTERILIERDLMLEMEMKRMENRGKVQRELEIEIQRLQRLNDLRSFCIRASRIQSLREIEEAKKTKEESQSKEMKLDEEENEIEDESSEALSPVTDRMVEQSPVCV